MAIVQPDLGLEPLVIPVTEKKEMISVRRDELGRTVVRVNSSSVSVIQECLRKAQYSLHEEWRAVSESPATLFGRAVHKALEIFYRGAIEERVLPRFAYLEMMAYGNKPPPTNNDLIYRAVAGFLEVAEPLSGLPETDKRSLQNGVWILHKYFEAFIDDPYVALVDDHGPFIERTFSYRIHEDTSLVIDVFGTIDFAFRHTVTGEVLVGDHKTTSQLYFGGSSYYDRDKPNHQYTLYMLGANKVLGLKTDSFMVNVIEVKEKPKRPQTPGPKFPRQITKRTEEDFDEVREVIMKVVRDYLEAIETEVWPMGGVDACGKYGGCQFRQVCAAPRVMRETLLMNKFTRNGETDATAE